MSITIRPGTKLSYGVRVQVPLPPVAYFVDSAVGIINEGDTMTFNVSTTAVPDGTVLYWKVENETTTDARFAAVSGSVTVSAGAGSFGITPLADLQTEGTTVFHVTLRTGSVGGTVVWTTGSKAIGDTSLTPPVHGSALFNRAGGNYLSVAQPSYTAGGAGYGAWAGLVGDAPIFKGDYPQPQVGWTAIGHAGDGPYRVTLTNVVDGGATWILYWTARTTNNLYKGQNWTLYDPAAAPFNLGTTWTIEFWLYMNGPSESIGGSGIQGLVNQGGWYYGLPSNSMLVGLAGGKLTVCQGTSTDAIEWFEPTPQQWVHVAVVNNGGTQRAYYNGIEQVKTNDNGQNGNYTNIELPVYIGALAPPYGSPLSGKLTNLRITNTAVYTANFYPPTTLPTKIAGTRLLWTPTDQALATDTSDSASVMTNNGASYSSSYPAVNSTRGSAVFDGSTNRYYRVPGGGHFQLGQTWTIEWWQKSTAGTAGNGNIYAVMAQAPDNGRIDIYYQSGNLKVQNGQTLCAEPAIDEWVHVALVNNAGSGTVYYNGVAQGATGNFGNYGQTQDLYIGKRGNNAFQYFNGRLTDIRITDSAVYTENFVPNQPITSIANHTKLLLRPTVDTIYGVDEGNLGLAVASAGATYSVDYPVPIIQGTTITDTVAGDTGTYQLSYVNIGAPIGSITVKDAPTMGAISIVGTELFYIAPKFLGSFDPFKGYDHAGSEIDNFSLYFKGLGNPNTVVPVSITITAT
jgi:Concanavalin A-like lectin/glucanases superfamily